MANKIHNIDGSLSVGNSANIGGKLTTKGDVEFKGNVRVEGFLECDKMVSVFKGFFTTEDLLKAAYPNPELGWVAIVGATIPGNIYDVANNQWHNTGKTGGALQGNVGMYAQQVASLQEALAASKEEAIDLVNDAKEATKASVPYFYDLYKGDAPIASDRKVTSGFIVYFHVYKNRFVAYNNGIFYGEWEESGLYSASLAYGENGTPITGKLYRTEEVAYAWNGRSLEMAALLTSGNLVADIDRRVYENADAIAVLQDNPAIKLTWDATSNLNEVNKTGLYYIHGTRSNEADNMPITNMGEIVAWLRVANVDSSNSFISQTLELGNMRGADTKVYTRSYNGVEWTEWQSVQGLYEKNLVSDIGALNAYTDNGMYSGMIAYSSIASGISAGAGSAFLLITVNGYAATSLGFPAQVTQMLYLLPRGTESVVEADMYLRTGLWEGDSVMWMPWKKMATEAHVADVVNNAVRNMNEALLIETQQLRAADTALGNRITVETNMRSAAVDNLSNRLTEEIANEQMTRSAAVSNIKSLLSHETSARESADYEMRASIKANMDSIDRIGGRVTTAEGLIIGLQGNITTLQTEVVNIKDNEIPQAVAEGIAEVVANAPEDLDTLKEVADYIASDKTKAAQIETAISNLQKADTTINANIAKNASDIANNMGALANQQQAIDLLVEEVATKAPKVGYTPDLKVDFAKELVGRGVAEPQYIGSIRPTGLISIGDGNATIEKVKGKSVVWNQQIKPTAPHTTNGVTFTMQDDGTVTMSGVSTATALFRVMGNEEFIAGHTYVITGGFGEGHSFEDYMLSVNVGGIYKYTAAPNVLFKADSGVTLDLYVRIASGIDTNNLSVKPKSHDLTHMFREGNEPTTIEEFEARKPLGVSDDYNEGEIISYDAKELKSVGFNAFNGTYAKVIGGQQYHALGNITSIGITKELGGETTEVTLDSEGMFTPTEDGYVYAEGTDICIHLTHTYTPEHTTEYEEDVLTLPNIKAIKDKDGNTLFPNGLLSAGSVHDEITANKAVKRIGVVDMGALKWDDYTQYEYGYISKAITAMKSGNLNFETKLPYKKIILTSAAYLKTIDKIITNNLYVIGPSFAKSVLIKDTSYTDVATFKAAMSGVMLYYELAEPIEVDLPEPLNLTYDAWDFGTEELIAEGKTTPLNADIVYQFNAVDRIRENTAKNQALETELAELKAQLTQLTQASNDENSNT